MKLGKESETIEYKKTTGELKEGIISIVSILNKHNKGNLYFGVRNDGIITGQEVSDKTLRDISQAIASHIEPRIYPTIQEVSIDDKICIHVSFEGDNVPYFAYGRAYIRIADEDRILSPDELREYFAKQIADATPWDSSLSDKKVDDINESLLIAYIEKSNLSGRLDYPYTVPEDILTKFDLLKDGFLTNTAKIMFCKNSGLESQMAIFATNERLTFNDIKSESGTVSELVSVLEKYIKNNMRWRVVLDGSMQRKEIPEIPVDAIREALVNSFCHRDYRSSQNNEVSIFKNRIEIYNPGTFPQGLTPQDFIEGSERSIKRNPQLAEMLFRSKDVEKFGTGLRRITNSCNAAGTRVDFQILKTGFVVVFHRNETEDLGEWGGKSGCFITTACVTALGCPDNGYELAVLRSFRDGWLKFQPGGTEAIQKYYQIAPKVVEAINAISNSAEVYAGIFREFIHPCIAHVETDENEAAFQLYRKMFDTLVERYLKV